MTEVTVKFIVLKMYKIMNCVMCLVDIFMKKSTLFINI